MTTPSKAEDNKFFQLMCRFLGSRERVAALIKLSYYIKSMSFFLIKKPVHTDKVNGESLE